MTNDIFRLANEKLRKKGYCNLGDLMESIDEYYREREISSTLHYEYTHPGMCRGWELAEDEEIFDFSILAKEVG